MYTVDGDDRVAELREVPQCETGAPLPVVLSDEGHILLAYLVSETGAPGVEGVPWGELEEVSPDSGGRDVAFVKFTSPTAHMFGPPNVEGLPGHPLYERGLTFYSACEVTNSSWIRILERMDAVHPNYSPGTYNSKWHCIFAFHDSTFECVAEGFEISLHRGSIRSIIPLMADMIFG